MKPIFPSETIVEQEYQKVLEKHGIRKRPDIIIHIPYEKGLYPNRYTGNFVAIQLKLRASETKAKEDFNTLDLMFERLKYPLGIFSNIDSDKTFFDCYSGNYKSRLYCFAVQLVEGEVVVHQSP